MVLVLRIEDWHNAMQPMVVALMVAHGPVGLDALYGQYPPFAAIDRMSSILICVKGAIDGIELLD